MLEQAIEDYKKLDEAIKELKILMKNVKDGIMEEMKRTGQKEIKINGKKIVIQDSMKIKN